MTDYRASAERDASFRYTSEGQRGAIHALLAIHDLLDERLPKPEPKRCDATFSLVGDEQFECALTPGHGGNHVEYDGIVVWSDPPTPDRWFERYQALRNDVSDCTETWDCEARSAFGQVASRVLSRVVSNYRTVLARDDERGQS